MSPRARTSYLAIDHLDPGDDEALRSLWEITKERGAARCIRPVPANFTEYAESFRERALAPLVMRIGRVVAGCAWAEHYSPTPEPHAWLVWFKARGYGHVVLAMADIFLHFFDTLGLAALYGHIQPDDTIQRRIAAVYGLRVDGNVVVIRREDIDR